MGSGVITAVLAAIVTLVGSGGIVFGAMRYNRDEAGRVVTQQNDVLTGMRGLNDEMSSSYQRMRDERNELLDELRHCRAEIAELRVTNDNVSRAMVDVRDERDELLAAVRDLRTKVAQLWARLDGGAS